MIHSPSAPLGVAVVGTGFGQKVHIPGFQTHDRTQVVAVYHREPAKAAAIADAHHIPHGCSDLDTLLALPEVEAVSLATPPFLHFAMAKAILKAGKHLLLEKPTTLTVDEAIALQALATDRNLQVVMDFEYRVVPEWQYFQELIAQNYVGTPYLIRIDWLMSSRANPQRAWNWYARKDQGGGALGSLGSHSFDYIPWLFGPVRRLQAHLSTAIRERPDPLQHNQLKPVDSDDTCLLTLELEKGTPLQLAISSVSQNGRGHWIEVYGDRGTLILGSPSQTDYIYGFKIQGAAAGDTLKEFPLPDRFAFPHAYPDGRLSAFLRIIDRFVKSIYSQQPVAPSLQEGIYSQLLMDLTHQSDRTGQWVSVPALNRV
ncbi:MAG: Gfo/Idh/MocA family protein [Prochlorotrichaceae cyanobacterium]